MKKTVSVLLILLLVLGSIPTFAAWQNEGDIMTLLSELNIMQGDPDGNFRLDDPVSRAESAKIAIATSQYRDSVAFGSAVSPFKDVPASHWAAPYIQLAVNNGICKGYTDATFRPDGTVLYEEAVTMLLTVLGYTASDFGNSWPYGQIGLGKRTGLCDNIDRNIGDTLNRRDMMQLVYNLLNTKAKGGAVDYIESLDYTIKEDVTLIATAREDSSVGNDKVVTDGGTFKINSSFHYDNIGKRGDAVIKNGDELVAFIPSEQIITSYQVTDVIGSDLIVDGSLLPIDENLKTFYKSQATTYQNAVAEADKGDSFTVFASPNGVIDYAMLVSANAAGTDTSALDRYVVYSKLENAILGYKNGSLQQIDLNDGTTAYKDKVKTTYSAIKPELSMGDILYVKKDAAGNVDYISYEKGNMDGPYTVTSTDWLSRLATDANTTVTRDGSKVSANEVQKYDIIYYSKDLNMVLAYSNKVTGVYEKADPNKDEPTGITVSGVEYKIESVTAFDKLSSSGSFQFGDTVTLLLGKSNQIADVVSPEDANAVVYGYMFESGTKEFTANDTSRYVGNYIKVALPDGGVYEYAADKNYSDIKNRVVRVSFNDGVAKTSTILGQSAVSGSFDWKTKKLGGHTLSPDIKILDISTIKSNTPGKYVTVFPQRLDQVYLDLESIVYAEKNEKNEITELILLDATGDMYSYGMILQAETKGASGSYTYDINGTTNSTMTAGKAFPMAYSGVPAKFIMADTNSVDSIQSLTRIEDTVTKVTYNKLTAGNKDYPLSDRVIVYKKDGNNKYTILPLTEIISGTDYTLIGYYDKKPELGGRVRVILATK